MKQVYKVVKVIAVIIFILGIISIAVYNLKNNTNFFQMSLTDLITLLIAIVLSYFFTEKNSNIRKRKEVIEILIEKIQLKLESDVMTNINDEDDIKRVNINKRSIDNNLNLLKSNAQNLGVEKDIEYLMEQFNNYTSIIDYHINDMPYLKSSKMDLERYLTSMCDKLNKIRIDLY